MALIFLKTFAWAYFLAPWAIRRSLGSLLGRTFCAFGYRTKVVKSNLKLVFPGDSAETMQLRERIFRDSYEHFGHLVLEIPMLFGPMPAFVRKNVDFIGFEYWEKANALGRGVIYLSSHLGNWEIMAASGALRGMDLMIVTKRLKPAWLHDAITTSRLSYGVRGAFEPRTFKDVFKHLRRGGTVGFVLDQYAGPPVGVRVPFLGVPVGTATALAAAARRTGAPVLPVVNERLPDGRNRLEIFQPFEWIKEETLARELTINTAAYVAWLEKPILRVPEQWLWVHRRFKGDLSPLKEENF